MDNNELLETIEIFKNLVLNYPSYHNCNECATNRVEA